ETMGSTPTAILAAAALLAACGTSSGNEDASEDPAPDVVTDVTEEADPDVPGDVAEEETPRDCTMPSPSEQEALDDEVHAYIVTDDDSLLTRLDADLCFEAFAQAIRAPQPADDPSPGVIATSFPYASSSATLHLWVSSTAVLDGSTRVPLIVWLHGAGDSGANNINSTTLRGAADSLGGILAVPTSTSTCDWSASDVCAALVHNTVRKVKREYPIDDDRVYITGFSMGGRGSYTDGLTWPDMFAGVAPIAGTIGACHGTLDLATHAAYITPHIENARHQRVRLLTGLMDNEYLVAQNEAASGVFDSLGYDFVWDALAGVGHSFPQAQWTSAMSWLSEHSRDPYPPDVLYNMAWHASSYYENLFMNNTLNTNVFWVRIDSRISSTEAGRVDASIDGQTISATTENIVQLSVYLADELIDLDSPVTITINGSTWYEGLVERSPSLALRHAKERQERTMVFAARIQDMVP
ncbi:MAG: hypothetical protein JRG91_18490, partial [Deltaproteobacteria bacterium]|nr:hypothetical protein [Deltaproteobacteria bacterium]